jgi:predicted PurR-regulated permease PerM
MKGRRTLFRRLPKSLADPPTADEGLDLAATDRDPRGIGLLLALVVASIAFLWLAVRPLLAPLVLAALAAVVFEPLHRRIERRLGARTNRAAMTSLLLLLVFVGGPVAGFAVLLVAQTRRVLGDFLGLAQGQTITSRLNQLMGQYFDWLGQLGERYLGRAIDLSTLGIDRARDLSAALYASLPDLLAYAGGMVFSYLIFTVALFFLLRDRHAVVHLILEIAPMEPSHALKILVRLRDTVRAVFLGSVLTSVFQGTFGAIGFFLAGFPNFAVWGALTAVASFIPVIGTALVWGPAVLFLLVNGDGLQATLMLAFGLFISTTDNVLRLLFLGTRMAVHPLILFVSVFGGLTAVGPMGVVYGPLLAACAFEALGIYREHLRLTKAKPAAAPAPTEYPSSSLPSG